MSRGRILQMAAMIPLLLSTAAVAEMFKCKGADGKTVFSDTRCEGAAPPPPAAPKKPAAGGRYELTSADQERIKVLEALVIAKDSSSELKTGAQLEVSNIRRGAESTLSADERKRREALMVDLGSADPKKRTEALRMLRTFYDR